MHGRIGQRLQVSLALLLSSGFSGCNRSQPVARVQVIFDQVPSPGRSGAGTVDTLRGRVLGASMGQRIVVYAFGENTWWVQPTALRHFTSIDGTGSWSTVTHLGDRYAVLLVDEAFEPPDQLKSLPTQGGPIVALATVVPSGTRPPSLRVHFSNYDWTVRQVGSDRNGSPHAYSPKNVRVDSRGTLHLAISKDASGVACAEVSLPRSLGFGNYAFTLEDASRLDPAAILDFYTWDEGGTDQERREVDALVSRWGDDTARTNAQYIVQPFFRPANTYRYLVPAGPITLTLHWEPSKITYETRRGDRPETSVVARHTFTSDVPTPAAETLHMNLCTFDYGRLLQREPSEIVMRRFRFEP